MNQTPVWIQTTQLVDWPTQVISNPDLHYQLPICESWASKPHINTTPVETEHFFQGANSGEGMSIKFMGQANPEDNMCNWVDALVTMTGFPFLVIQQSLDLPPQLLQWHYNGPCPPLTKRLEVDETHLYQGLAKTTTPVPSLIRLYTLLARRNNLAWQVCLSISSACLPGTIDEALTVNDHVRAGATFGFLVFL